MEAVGMEPLEMFRKMRDVCDEVIKGLESEDAEATESAMGKFIMLMLKLDALK